MTLFDHRICGLGEGALWHPQLQELFWFDITGKRLLSRPPASGVAREWAMAEMCSAAAWIDEGHLLIASETALSVFEIESGRANPLVLLEANNARTRSNDGRADPWGGFWIGTMGKAAEPGAGGIYRYFGGSLRRLFEGISIPNAICFAPDKSRAYFADTARAVLFWVPLDIEGWPIGTPDVLVDFSAHGLWPDGAVTMADGSLRLALWGAGAVITVSPDGEIGERIMLPAPHTTCPAFGGRGFDTLFCTSATQGLSAEQLEQAPLSGATFEVMGAGRGRPEPAFHLQPTGDGS